MNKCIISTVPVEDMLVFVYMFENLLLILSSSLNHFLNLQMAHIESICILGRIYLNVKLYLKYLHTVHVCLFTCVLKYLLI